METIDVLIVGAGPTGLVLAAWLTRFGVSVRIVDKAPEPGHASRAVGVQARTLELYRQIGLDAAIVNRGLPFAAANLWVKGTHRGRVEFGSMGEGLSPYPYMLIFPQDEHEKLLIEHLASTGVRVERPSKLVAIDEHADRMTAKLERADGGVEICEARYIAGCDGARSFVRDAIDTGFPGGTYAHLFYVADVEASGPPMNGELHGALDDSDFVACFPLKERTHARLIGTVRPEAEKQGEELDFSVVNQRVIERMHLEVKRVKWFSTYHVHHRVASVFRRGRTFLLGDAAHIHSPVGGQGMNTGIGDAVNLAWKLAATLQGRATAELLDTYEQERVPFAQRLVATTDRAFEFVSADGPVASFVRTVLAPPLLTTITRSATVRRLMFNTISQIQLTYRSCGLNEGRAGRVHGGDRLPWVRYGASDNFAPLTSLDWQAHVYGHARSELRAACVARPLPLHVFAWTEQAQAVGLARDALYLVRPDGYVAMAADDAHAAAHLDRYFAAHGFAARA